MMNEDDMKNNEKNYIYVIMKKRTTKEGKHEKRKKDLLEGIVMWKQGGEV